MTSWTCAAAGLALALGTAAASSASAQGADGAFAAFHQACMATAASPAQVTRVTDGHGWKPGDASGNPIAGFTVDKADTVIKSTFVGPSELKLYAWHGVNKAGYKADECQIAVSKTDFEAVRSAAATSLGFAAQQSSPDKSVFQYTGTPDAPKPVDSSGFDAAAVGGGLDLLTISRQGGGAFLSLLRLSK